MTGRMQRFAATMMVRHVVPLAMCVLSGVSCRRGDGSAEPDSGTGAPLYALFAVQPAAARVNDTITLEGTFGDSVTVHFPGGASVPASVIGRHRASVVVPPSATVGDLTVTTGDAVIGRLKFHGAAFPLGLGKAESNLEQADAARQMTSLVISRHDHASVVIGRYLYAIGGADQSNSPLDSVEGAIIAADGSLGPFSVLSDVKLATKRYGHTAAVLGAYLYVIGGNNESSVERATIHDDGSLGTFATVACVALFAAHSAQASVVVGNYLYVLGGERNEAALATVERAPIATDGSLGPFVVLPETALTVGRSAASATVVANYLYVVGGRSGSTYLKTVERAAITGDGAIGPFSMVDTTLSTGRYGHTTIVLGNALYIQGGLIAEGINHIERAVLGADGSIGMFAIAPRSAMATVRSGHTNAVIGNYLYALGGSGAAEGTLSTVERAAINTGGAIRTFDANTGTSLQTASESHTSAVIGNHLYVFGGGNAPDVLSRVERADIAADGSLGPFTKPRRTALSTGRIFYACAVAGNHIYLIGGRDAYFTPTFTIDESVVAADGTLGFIEPAIVRLQTLRYSHTAVTIGNHLYVIGGSSNTVEHARIAPDGSLGPFGILPGVNVSVPRFGHSSVVLGNFLYNLGGSDSSALTTVERATINPDGSLGPFAIVPGVTLGDGRAFHASVVVGNYLYVFGGMNQTGTPLDSVERAAVAADGSLGPFVPVPGVKLITARFGLTAVAVAGQVYVIGGRGLASGRLTSVERATLDSGDGL